jgi:MFS family permease
MGSGVRLLPLLAGLLLGALPSALFIRWIGAKLVMSLGFLILVLTGLWAASTTLGTGAGVTAAWMVAGGLGMGLVFAPAASAALAQIDAERSGVASGVLQAINKMGGPLGAAVFGSALSSVYQAHLPVTGLTGSLVATMKEGLTQGLAVARKLASPALTHGVQAAFVRIGLVLTLLFMPLRTPALAPTPESGAADPTGAGPQLLLPDNAAAAPTSL